MAFWGKLIKSIREKAARRGYSCDACGAEIFDYPYHRLCQDCEESLGKNNGKTCEKCGRKTLADGVCLTCKRDLPKFTVGVSPFVYRGEISSFINRIKNGKPRLVYYFGEQMARLLVTRGFCLDFSAESEEEMLIIPVPLTKEREAKRGYNQAEELANVVEAELQQQGVRAVLDREVLIKTRETQLQKRLGFTARAENVEGAYHVHKRTACKGKTILLIDDIMTTGATGSECARLLLSAGARKVVFLVAAALPERRK